MNSSDDAPVASPVLGWAMIGFGAIALMLSFGIASNRLGDNHDPGPRALPLIVAVGLMAGGAWEALLGRRQRQLCRAPVTCLRAATHRQAESADRGTSRRLVIFLAALLAYLGCIPLAGFAAASFVFAALSMRWLGTRWPHALISSVLLVVLIHFLFVNLFKIPLPTGAMGLPF